MPDFTQWNVPSPFPNILYNPAAVDAAIAKTQSELGNLDINRQELQLKKDEFGQTQGFTEYLKRSLPTGDVTGATGAIPADSTPFEQKMGLSEGGRSATKVNDQGYAGQYQFGASRLADLGLYTPAPGENLKKNEWKGQFKIAPYGVANLQDFLGSPAAQHAAFVAHVADIDKAIASTPGADKFDVNGLRAVAHLGGVGGMREFIASGGNLNRHDSNGTSLKAYYQKFADGGAPALQTAFGSAHGPGGPPSDTPAVLPGGNVSTAWVDPNAPLPVPPIPPAGGPPPAFNPNTGPRVAGASPAGAPQAAPGITPPRAVGDNPNGPAPTPTITGQADETAPAVAQTKTAMRLNGTDVAGPPGVVPAAPDVQPNRMAYGTDLPGVTIGLPTNGMAPPPAAATPTAPPPGTSQSPARPPLEAPPPAPSRVIQREPLIQSGIFAGLTRTQANTIAQTPGVKPAVVMQQIAEARHQNDVIRQGDATQAAIEEKENYARRQAAVKDAQDRADKAEAQRIAAAANAREAAKAHEENLNNLTPKIEDGTATPAEKRLYAGSYYALQQQGATATTMDDPNNPGQKIPAMITRRLPKNFPEPEGGALPLVMSSPGAPTKPAATTDEGKSATFADRMAVAETIMKPLDTTAVTWSQGVREKAGNYIGYNVNSTDYQKLRTAQEAFLSAIIRDESGAAVSDAEWKRYAHIYFPMPGDDAEQIKLKQQFRQVAQESEARKAGAGYKPTAAAAAATQPTAPKVIKYDATGKRVTE